MSATAPINEDLQAALTDLEDAFCDCRRFTTSDRFWLGDHEPDCALVEAMGNKDLVAELKKVTAELERVTGQYKGQRTAAHVNWDKQHQLKAELEKCLQDAFNSGRDVQHRIDGRESAGFAELPY